MLAIGTAFHQPTLLASVTKIISQCALGTPKHLALATLSLSSSNVCCSCGPQRQVVLFLIRFVRMALVQVKFLIWRRKKLHAPMKLRTS